MPFVYRATNKANQKAYIGICKGAVRKRWRRHCSDAISHRHGGCAILWRAIRKYREASFVLETLYEAVDWREACAVERALIAHYGTMRPRGYNITAGGQGTLGYKAWAGRRHTAETKAKMSVWQIGKKHSAETKRKIAERAKGRKKSAAEIEEMRRRPFSAAHRAKIRAALKDRYFSPEHRAKITEGLKRRWARYHEAHG
jgi:group I intron endonuclease